MQMETMQKYHFIPSRMAVIKRDSNKFMKIMKRLEPFFLVGLNVKWFELFLFFSKN